MAKKSEIYIEFTTTNNCNCHCKYCFEHQQCNVLKQSRNIEEEQRQIALLKTTCLQFNKEKHNWLTVSFWGGEPLLNVEFMKLLIEATCNYDFVRYHIYSNGTLTKNFKELFEDIQLEDIKRRIHVLLSYDGEPHNTLMRGNTSADIFLTADLLKLLGIQFSFKATLSFDLLDKLPDIWKSYELLYEKYGISARYSPTLDTTYKSDDKIHVWTKSLIKVATLEHSFIKKHRRPLWSWFDQGKHKSNCMLGNSIHILTDGTIYICHGCAYKYNNERFKLGNTSSISSFFEVLSDKYNMPYLPKTCNECIADHCQVCHIEQLPENCDPYSEWIACRTNNYSRCKYFKVFGFVSKLLKLTTINKI